MEIKIDQASYSDITIIMYHYVIDTKNHFYRNINGIQIQSFIKQLKYFKKHYNFIKIEDLLDSINNKTKLPTKSLILTFDDGYSDHFENVYPILKHFNIQGSFYIPAKTVLENKVLDVNKIHFIIARETNISNIIKDIRYLLNKYKLEYKLKDFDSYYRKLAFANRFDNPDVIFIKRLLQVELIEDLRSKIVDYLFKKYVGEKESDFAKKIYLNTNQIKTMINNGMHVGCHGYNHYWWNNLNIKNLESEIDSSLSFLDQLGVNINNWTAAYPYGSYNENVIKLIKKKKCSLAFTTEVGISNNLIENKFLMKRLETNHMPILNDSSPNNWYNLSN